MPQYIATKYRKGLMGTKDKVLVDSLGDGTAALDTISEKTSGAGVTTDGVLLKDGNITASGSGDNAFTGNIGFGGAPYSTTKVRAAGSPGSGAAVYGFYSDLVFASTATGNCSSYVAIPSLVAASFTMANLYQFRAYGATVGSGATLTNQYGFFADASLTTGGTNYGFYSNIAASGTARYNFYAAGTAPNLFQGPIITGRDTITASAAAAATITVTGSYQSVAGYSGAASAIQTINGGITGMRVVCRAASDSVDITFESGGNIALAGGTSFVLDTYLDTIEFIYDGTLSKWLELSRSNNS